MGCCSLVSYREERPIISDFACWQKEGPEGSPAATQVSRRAAGGGGKQFKCKTQFNIMP